jgi:hypothetical protein
VTVTVSSVAVFDFSVAGGAVCAAWSAGADCGASCAKAMPV